MENTPQDRSKRLRTTGSTGSLPGVVPASPSQEELLKQQLTKAEQQNVTLAAQLAEAQATILRLREQVAELRKEVAVLMQPVDIRHDEPFDPSALGSHHSTPLASGLSPFVSPLDATGGTPALLGELGSPPTQLVDPLASAYQPAISDGRASTL
jgi:hypothetical protein